MSSAHCVGAIVSLSLAAGSALGQLTVTVNPGSAGIIAVTNVSGTGTLADPLVIEENWFGASLTATIDIRGAATQAAAGIDPSGGPFAWGIYVQKRVTNNSGVAWEFFDNELQQILGVASSDGDGLSFGQGFAGARPFTSDIFADTLEEIDLRDFLNFRDGIVNPGQTVVLNFLITDNSPEDIFFLRQRPNFVPAPGMAGLIALGGLAAARRRR